MADLSSKIILAKGINVDRELKNVVDYTSTQMINLMTDSSHFVASDYKYSFIRNTGTIQTEFAYDSVLQSNYMAFQNTDYSSKWFFAWIDDVIYKGDNNTEIKYTVDAFTTFNKDLTYENCFVVREHVNDDTIGKHTIPENLETGEMIQEGTDDFISDLAYTHVAVLETDAYPTGGSHVELNNPQLQIFTGVTQYNNLTSGHRYIVCNSIGDLSKFVDRMNKDDAVDFIKNIFIMPASMFTLDSTTQNFAYDSQTSGQDIFYFYVIPTSTTVEIINKSVTKSYTFTGYTPKNNKCKVYPYNFLYITNNVGQSNIYKYEDFSTSDCQFDIFGCVCVGGSFMLVPKNYKGVVQNSSETLPLGKYPTCSWTSDAYTNWLSQQGVNMYAESGAKIIQGASQGAMVSGVHGAVAMAGINLAGEVADWIGQEKQAKITPNETGGSNTGNVNWAAGGNNFFIRNMHCKIEYIRIIDEYFTRFRL